MSMATRFRPVSGKLFGHLFENPDYGVPLGLYWNILIDFEPLVDDDEDEWECNLQFEWLAWPLRSWSRLDGCSLHSCSTVVPPEVSLYAFSKHQPIDTASFTLRSLGGTRFGIEAAIRLDLEDLEDVIAEHLLLTVNTGLEFEGLFVLPENLTRKPSDATQAAEALAAFADLSGYREPEFDGRRWVFAPRA